ncbi:hypothetical protein GEMRC1_012368 [Eukaryota sp. GEM-RC1]
MSSCPKNTPLTDVSTVRYAFSDNIDFEDTSSITYSFNLNSGSELDFDFNSMWMDSGLEITVFTGQNRMFRRRYVNFNCVLGKCNVIARANLVHYVRFTYDYEDFYSRVNFDLNLKTHNLDKCELACSSLKECKVDNLGDKTVILQGPSSNIDIQQLSIAYDGESPVSMLVPLGIFFLAIGVIGFVFHYLLHKLGM